VCLAFFSTPLAMQRYQDLPRFKLLALRGAQFIFLADGLEDLY